MSASPRRFRLTTTLALLSSLIFFAAESGLSPAAARAAAREKAEARTLLEEGAEAFQRGDFEKAATQWREAAQRGTASVPFEAQLNLSALYQLIGQTSLALEAAQKAQALAETSDLRQQAAAKNALGAAYILTREPDLAERQLTLALSAATRLGDDSLIANIQKNLGNRALVQKEYAEALEHYRYSAEAAGRAKSSSLLAGALANQAVAARRSGNFTEAERLAELAATEADNVALPTEKSTLLLSLGRTFQEMVGLDSAARERRLTRASQLLQQALASAQKSGAARSQSYALGYLGQLYAADGQHEAALRLSREAVFAAQRADSPDALFQWEWDSARAQKALHRPDEAIESYRRAIGTFQTVLHDWITSVPNRERQGSFRDEVGPMYLELADLLLKRTDAETNPIQVQSQLEDARRTLELLKAGEYADYFRESCVNNTPPQPMGIDTVAPRTAVFYLVPLPDRTELLLGLSGKLQRFQSPVGSEELIETVRDFRKKLEKRTTHQYLLPAQKLYDWLVRPTLPTLRDRLVDTVVFVPDGALRTVPLSALHDGEKFLVAEFAVATTPGLTLMDPRPLKQAPREMLLSGLSESVQGFPKLEYVPAELEQVRLLYGGKVLLNGDFATRRAEREFEKASYSLVHIASHGEFSSDPRKTFLLTYDGRLTLNELEKAIRPCQYRGRPVELLTLSACQTAVGDDRAALGLAGIALKAGARSALATLWFVNDQASAVLVSEFYTQLHQGSGVSKAAALRGAQINLMGDQRYRHPAFWAPYLIIGNWL